jgi:hypothetical protein
MQKRGTHVAQKVLTTLQDDVDGTKASETITFALDGAAYEIDLNARHANKLRKAFAPFITAGRRVGGRSTRRAEVAQSPTGVAQSPTGRSKPMTATPTPVDPAAVRAWAAANKVKVSSRGRIPAAAVAQFRAAGH